MAGPWRMVLETGCRYEDVGVLGTKQSHAVVGRESDAYISIYCLFWRGGDGLFCVSRTAGFQLLG